jgi:low affinity Fe/Cu permease
LFFVLLVCQHLGPLLRSKILPMLTMELLFEITIFLTIFFVNNFLMCDFFNLVWKINNLLVFLCW